MKDPRAYDLMKNKENYLRIRNDPLLARRALDQQRARAKRINDDPVLH